MRNFGRNVVYEPRHRYTPRTEEEVLAILAKHRDGSVRVQSTGHSWSRIIEADDALVRLSHFTSIVVETGSAGPVARIGAGATLGQIVAALRNTAYSLPTLGAITRQTVAGATATATHGTGSASLSSFVRAVRLACYDAGGNPVIKTIAGGDELLAARASLGCMGIILEMTLELVPKFWMHEVMRPHEGLDAVLEQEAEWPQQQFLVFPYGWRWYAYHRKRVPPSTARALRALTWYRVYDVLIVELVLHGLVKAVQGLARLFGAGAIRAFWTRLLPPVMRGMPVTGESAAVLTLHTAHHHAFGHVEMELFVPKAHLRDAVAFVQEAIPFMAGETKDVGSGLSAELARVGLLEDYRALHGTFAYHYVIFFRHILAEDTLLAMNEGGERYSVSLFSFAGPRRREEYYAACRVLARAFAKLYSARPHWGKYNPLDPRELRALYPRLDRFRAICRAHDPHGVFLNGYLKETLMQD